MNNAPLRGIEACVFDAYGTLFDFATYHSLARVGSNTDSKLRRSETGSNRIAYRSDTSTWCPHSRSAATRGSQQRRVEARRLVVRVHDQDVHRTHDSD